MPIKGEKNKVLKHVYLVTREILDSTRSRQISIKLRTLLRYAYVSYIKKTTNLNIIRGLVPRIRPPSWIANQYFYRDMENLLRNNFKVKIEQRRQFKYVTLYKD